jgi:hypothetical protein
MLLFAELRGQPFQITAVVVQLLHPRHEDVRVLPEVRVHGGGAALGSADDEKVWQPHGVALS